MKRALLALCTFVFAAPALAQQGATQIEVEGRALVNSWIAMFNKGDAAGLAKTVYATPDETGLSKMFSDLRADSFGKLEVYSSAFCGKDAEHGRAILKFARIYSYGGKMDDDEAKVFDLAKTPGGWRISAEKNVAFDTVLSCS